MKSCAISLANHMKSIEQAGLHAISTDVHLPEEHEAYVQALVDIANALRIDSLSFATFSSAICELSQEQLELKRSLLRVQYAHDELAAHLASEQHLHELTAKWLKLLQTEPSGDQSTAALERRKAALIAKAKDYQQQLTAIMREMPEAPAVTPSQVQDRHRELKAKEQVLREKRARVQAFQGIPPNLDLARLELRNARDEQTKLIQLRERLLDNMASGVN